MGYYIEVLSATGKAQLIADGKALVRTKNGWKNAPEYSAEIIAQPASLAEIPADKALICVIANLMFEGAGYCFDQAEFEAFTQPGDHRHRTWLLMDKDIAELSSGYCTAKAAV